MEKLHQYLNIKDGTYKTENPKKKLPWFLATSIFNLRMAVIVLKASFKAKRGLFTNDEWCKSSLSIVRALESVGAEFEIDGINNIQTLERPCVFIGNHMSTLETFCLAVMIQPFKDVTFIVKKELIEYPVFKHIMRSRNPIVVGRTNPREDLIKVIEQGTEKLNNGVSVIVFPQTTRKIDFIESEFNTIGIKLALRANAPIIPLALKTDIWTNGKIVKEFGRIFPQRKVHFSFGETLEIKNRGEEEHKKIIEFIKTHLEKWSKEDL